MIPEIERCLREIAAAERAVREHCDFGAYLWLQDWREELELLRRQDSGFDLLRLSHGSGGDPHELRHEIGHSLEADSQLTRR